MKKTQYQVTYKKDAQPTVANVQFGGGALVRTFNRSDNKKNSRTARKKLCMLTEAEARAWAKDRRFTIAPVKPPAKKAATKAKDQGD